MPASEKPGFLEHTLNFAAGGAAAGGFLALCIGGYNSLPAGETSMGYVGRLTMTHASSLAAVGAVFGATESLMDMQNPGSSLNPILAGCAAGITLGARQGSITTGAAACTSFAIMQAIGMFSWTPCHDPARALERPGCPPPPPSLPPLRPALPLRTPPPQL